MSNLGRRCAIAAVLAAGCSGGEPDAAEIRSRFAAFEAALRAGDQHRLCGLVTSESLPALEQIPTGAGDRRGALVVEALGRRTAARCDVAVREADGSAGGTFVMVRERGAWRVDLVESAAVTNGVEPGPASVRPAGLGAEQIDGIRANLRQRGQ